MKNILKTTVYNLIASAIVMGIFTLIFVPFWVAVFIYVVLNLSNFITIVLQEYVSIKNIKKLFNWIIKPQYKRYYFKTAGSGCLEKCPINKTVRIGSCSCQRCDFCIEKSVIGDNCFWIKCKHVSKCKFNFFSWIKKLFTLLLICTLLSSCSVYLNCKINKTQQLSKRQIDQHNKQAEKQTELQESIWY